MWGTVYNFFKQIKNILVSILFLVFCLSILAHSVSPHTTIFFAPFGLIFFPLFLAVLLVGLIYIRRNKYIAFTAFLLLGFSLRHFPGTFALNFQQKDEGLKILSWNVKNFDLYNWSKNQSSRREMLLMIDSIDANVLCFQEFYSDTKKYNNVAEIQKLGYPHYSFFPAYTHKNGGQWGLAIFSKHKIKNTKAIALNPSKTSINQCVRADINFNGKTYHIYNAHFQSIHLNYDDLDYIEKVSNKWSFIDNLKSWQILSKILGAYKSRTQQIHTFLKLKANDHNIILCCDLNDVPASYAYTTLSNTFQDAFREKGLGLSNTISLGVPILRIDYIFTTPDIHIHSFRRIQNSLSDHHILCSQVQ